ncbi:paramyosin-like [Trachinotus anak]|uniref:paramyosin-like n=1 Tax=Trachinotus anak TaxID=443729 RepID=UPI0039F25E48
MYINRGKETKRDLERLQKYTDPETLCTTKIATQVRDTIKRKKKKLLQKDYEELQVAHIISKEQFTADLKMERKKNKALQELQRLKALYQEVTQRYEADVLTVRQQAANLQHDLDKELKAHADAMTEDLLLEQELRAELDALHQKIEEISLAQQNAAKQEMFLRIEVEELNIQLSLNLQLSTELKAERENKHPLQEIITSHESEENQEEKPEWGPEEEPAETQENEPDRQEESLPNVEPKETDVCEEIHPEKRQKTSVWKRTRHLLGLRKPKRWKKPKEPTSISGI